MSLKWAKRPPTLFGLRRAGRALSAKERVKQVKDKQSFRMVSLSLLLNELYDEIRTLRPFGPSTGSGQASSGQARPAGSLRTSDER